MSHETVDIIIDGTKIKAEKQAAVIQVARKNGIDIPTLCYHEQLEPYGACRLCMVEVTSGRKTRFVTACNYTVDEGIVIQTRSEKVRHIRKLIIECLLALNPDVTILKEYAKEYGIGVPRFEKGNEDCIQCYLCMRVCDEVVGANAVGYRRRGVDREIFTAFAAPSDLCIGCGACAWICPTNYMTIETETLESFRTLPGSKRLCRYSLMGVMEGALCANSFRCWKCEVEQRFQDQLQTHPIFLGRSRKMKEIDAYVNQLNEMRG